MMDRCTLALSLSLGLALPATSCSHAEADPSAATARDLPEPVVVVTAPKEVEYRYELLLPATFEPFEQVELYTQVTGYLASVEVEIGDTVEAGQVIARVLVPQMRGEVQGAQASLLASQAEIRRNTESSQLAKLEKERRENLRRTEAGAIAQADVDAAAATHELAQADLSVARAAQKRAKAELTRLRALKGFATVHAPFSGTVTRRGLDAGALARVGTSSNAEPIVEVQRMDPLRLVVQIPEPLVPHVAKGHEITITADAFPGESWPGRIARMSGALDPMSRSMRSEIDVLNAAGQFKPGMSAKVRVTVTAIKGAITIPSSALRGEGEDRWVRVVKERVLVRQDVTVLSDTGKVAVITGGLSVSDALMIAGSPLAELGDTVQARSK